MVETVLLVRVIMVTVMIDGGHGYGNVIGGNGDGQNYGDIIVDSDDHASGALVEVIDSGGDSSRSYDGSDNGTKGKLLCTLYKQHCDKYFA